MATLTFAPDQVQAPFGTLTSAAPEVVVSYDVVGGGGNLLSFLSVTGGARSTAKFRYEIISDSNRNGILDPSDSVLGSLSYQAQQSFTLTGFQGSGFLRISDLDNSTASGAYTFQLTAQFLNATPSSQFNKGTNYSLPIKDYDGSLHGIPGFSGNSAISDSYKYQGEADVNRDGLPEGIFTNRVTGRWATVGVDPITGQINYNNNGLGGNTRVVGIYIDPLVELGIVQRFSDFDSQKRFQNDLLIDNLTLKTSGDFDGDGFQELYWKVNDGTAYLRSLMHADGNIQYANYQSESQVRDYLTANGYTEVIPQVIG